jgi:hypothetical protein
MTGPDTRDTDLDRIESALADGRATAGDPRERELQELALALRADSPAPSPDFTIAMDRRVAEGFGKPSRSRGLSLPNLWMPALAGAAVLILVAVVALASLGGGGSEDGTSIAVSGEAAPGGARSAVPSPAATDRSGLTGGGRHVERSVDLTISTPGDELQSAADGIGTVAESHRGFVRTSDVTTGDGASNGSFSLRVPQGELQSAIADISKLGHLRARSERGQDMTAPYNDVQDKLGNALLERRALKLKLRRAKGAKADAIRVRLAAVRADIASLSGRMRNLKRRTVYSTINVTLEEQRPESGGTGAAWDDAKDILTGTLAFTVRAMAVLLPLALLAALAGLTARVLRRRRREAPLL